MSTTTETPSGLSALLSLSQAASVVQPIPIPAPARQERTYSNGGGLSATKHRRLSSTGQTRRRMSDARDAASRPTPASLHSAASALATLSLSPTATTFGQISAPRTSQPHSALTQSKPIAVATSKRGGALAKSVPTTIRVRNGQDLDEAVDIDIEDDSGDRDKDDGPKQSGKNGKGSGKKRGSTFRCESCSKVYRHPSCLVKHRWEHSPHWREASKFLLSKHQQVQLLEAAAILSHLAPGSSLPEDRSYWPSFLSGGLLPPPATENILNMPHSKSSATQYTSSSVPSGSPGSLFPNASLTPNGSIVRARSGSVAASVSATSNAGGPRLHDYKLPTSGSSGITQIRPGLLAHPTASSGTTPQTSQRFSPSPAPVGPGVTMTPYGQAPTAVKTGVSPMAVPNANRRGHAYGDGYAYGGSGVGFVEYREQSVLSTSASSFGGHGGPPSSYNASSFTGTGGWSLTSHPRSIDQDRMGLRSGSVISFEESRSRSGSGERSDMDEDDLELVEEDGEDEESSYELDVAGSAGSYAERARARDAELWKVSGDGGRYGRPTRAFGFNERAAVKEEEEWDGMEMEMEL